MTIELTAMDLCARLKLPLQNLTGLSFCSTKPAAVKAWAEALPATRIGHTSVLLYQVLPEFSRISIVPEKRLEMLEALRPFVQQCIEGLSKDFLNQPLLLSDAAIKAATVAQALQKHMCNAYAVCVRDLIQARKYDEASLLLALHRAATGLGLMLMRSYQLYTPIRGQIWHQLFSFYLIAQSTQLLHKTCADSLARANTPMSFEQVCVRALLLACVRPNQLRQHEVVAVYHALESWSSESKLAPCGAIDAENLHLVCLGMDAPPMYRTHYKGALDDSVRELDNNKLLVRLKDLRDRDQRLPASITPVLLDQLIQAWDLPSLRNFERLPMHTELEVCVGLGNVCSHLSGLSADENKRVVEREASHFDARSTSAQADPWAKTSDTGGHFMGDYKTFTLTPEAHHEEPEATLAPTHLVTSLDTSPGGYCLNWRDEMPALARVGEVVGLKERQRTRWNVGVIRWVQQSARGTQMGVQLLAPMAEAVEISMINKVGDDGHYMRALLLPALKVANQAATLICASMPFHEHAKILLRRGDSSVAKVQLLRKLFATCSLSQFNYRELELGSADKARAAASDDAAVDKFDESW